ncbi:zinc finger, CCHC-type containing protein [Tanacetum coccineum]
MQPAIIVMSCGAYICNTTQGLNGSKKLKPGALNMYTRNGHRATVEAIRSSDFILPNEDNGFVNCFVEDHINSVSKDNLVYFYAISRDGIYEIDLHCSNSDDSSIYSISNKIAKINLNSTILWHCHLGHINKKRIEKLQHDGLLKSTNDESFDKCVSCMSGKIY